MYKIYDNIGKNMMIMNALVSGEFAYCQLLDCLSDIVEDIETAQSIMFYATVLDKEGLEEGN